MEASSSPRTRERLETLLPQFKSLSDQVGANPRASRDDRSRLEPMATEVNQLVAVLKGERTLSDLSGSTAGGDSFAGHPAANLYGGGGASTKAHSLGAPRIEFSNRDLEALHKGVQNSQVVPRPPSTSPRRPTPPPRGSTWMYRSSTSRLIVSPDPFVGRVPA